MMERERKVHRKCRVNVKLIPIKITYFLLFGAFATLLPYLPVFMGFLKLTPIQMSIILSVATALSSPVRLIVGYLADRLQKRSTVFFVASILTMMFHLALYFTPIEDSPTITNNEYSTDGSLCSKSNRFILEAFNETLLLNGNITSGFNKTEMTCCPGDEKNGSSCLNLTFYKIGIDQSMVDSISNVERWFSSQDSQIRNESFCIDFQNCNRTMFFELEPSDNTRTFWMFFILFFFALSTYCPLQNILDSLIHSFLKSTGRPEDFGKNCLWGTVGLGLCALASGLIQDTLSERGWFGRKTYVFSFAFFSFGMLLAACMSLLIRTTYEVTDGRKMSNRSNFKKVEVKSVEPETNPITEESVTETFAFKKDLTTVMCGFYLGIIITTAMTAGILGGCLEGFFYYFLVSLDPNNKSVVGICLVVECTCEVIVLFFSGKIKLLIGPKGCFYIVFVVFPIRFMACSYLTNPWFGVIVDASHSICFGLLFPIMSSWASSLVPSHLQSTVQCYLGAIYFSIGRAAGTGIAGVLYEKLGPRVMFQVFAAISGGYLIVLVFIFEVLDRIRQKKISGSQTSSDKDEAKPNVSLFRKIPQEAFICRGRLVPQQVKGLAPSVTVIRAAESQQGPQGRTSLRAPCQNTVNSGFSQVGFSQVSDTVKLIT